MLTPWRHVRIVLSIYIILDPFDIFFVTLLSSHDLALSAARLYLTTSTRASDKEGFQREVPQCDVQSSNYSTSCTIRLTRSAENGLRWHFYWSCLIHCHTGRPRIEMIWISIKVELHSVYNPSTQPG
jgi:hypothetical protein